jgi:hypothetical protein
MLVHRACRAGAGNAPFRCAGLGVANLAGFASPAIVGFSSTLPSGVWVILVCEAGHDPAMILDSASLGGTSAFAPATETVASASVRDRNLKSGAGCDTALRQVAARNPRAPYWRSN